MASHSVCVCVFLFFFSWQHWRFRNSLKITVMPMIMIWFRGKLIAQQSFQKLFWTQAWPQRASRPLSSISQSQSKELGTARAFLNKHSASVHQWKQVKQTDCTIKLPGRVCNHCCPWQNTHWLNAAHTRQMTSASYSQQLLQHCDGTFSSKTYSWCRVNFHEEENISLFDLFDIVKYLYLVSTINMNISISN